MFNLDKMFNLNNTDNEDLFDAVQDAENGFVPGEDASFIEQPVLLAAGSSCKSVSDTYALSSGSDYTMNGNGCSTSANLSAQACTTEDATASANSGGLSYSWTCSWMNGSYSMSCTWTGSYSSSAKTGDYYYPVFKWTPKCTFDWGDFNFGK